MTDARRRLTDALPAIGDAAAAELAAQHRDDPISVSLEEAEFPLKAYDGFALPSGGYLAPAGSDRQRGRAATGGAWCTRPCVPPPRPTCPDCAGRRPDGG